MKYGLWLMLIMGGSVIGFLGWWSGMSVLLTWVLMSLGGVEWSMVLYFDFISILFLIFMLVLLL